MTAETAQSVVKTFKFEYPACTNEELLFKLEVPVEIPHNGSTRELVQRVINMFHIPVYLEDELNENLAEFVQTETKNYHNERDEKLLDQLKNRELNVEGIIKGWEKLFKENLVEFAEQKGTSDEEVFATAYHKLVHSPALETILQVENSYAKTVSNTLKSRDEDIRKLTESQTNEMDEKIRLLNTETTEEDINEVATRQFEQQALAAGRWGSQLDALTRAQRAAHRAWLLDTLARLAHSHLHTPSNSPLADFPLEPLALPSGVPSDRLEESFTIHLGNQLKQTHNVRIVAMDMLQLCALDHHNPAETSRRLQTSLSLYSSELSACVLVYESGGSLFGSGRDSAVAGGFLRAASSSTEHHFLSAEAQFQNIAEKIKEVTEHPKPWGRGLRPGDVALTAHSNLADTHLVAHLVAGDAAGKPGDITSRHPAILGLRNVLKAAAANDVASISIPLLLRHDLSEETTAAWCLRRAELVLKCVKGFVLEAAGTGPVTLHFLVPESTAPALFHSLAALIPAVFRISNPVKVKPPVA